jgi:hypothetical protein
MRIFGPRSTRVSAKKSRHFSLLWLTVSNNLTAWQDSQRYSAIIVDAPALSPPTNTGPFRSETHSRQQNSVYFLALASNRLCQPTYDRCVEGHTLSISLCLPKMVEFFVSLFPHNDWHIAPGFTTGGTKRRHTIVCQRRKLRYMHKNAEPVSLDSLAELYIAGS